MNTLLIFFALPLATIIISIALQKLLRNPLLVAAVIFAIFLVVTFIIENLNFLIATIVYTIISLITALIVKLICKIFRCFNNNDNNAIECNVVTSTESNDSLSLDSFSNDSKVNVIPHNEYRNCRR